MIGEGSELGGLGFLLIEQTEKPDNEVSRVDEEIFSVWTESQRSDTIGFFG